VFAIAGREAQSLLEMQFLPIRILNIKIQE
jgi:hypothetical protein